MIDYRIYRSRSLIVLSPGSASSFLMPYDTFASPSNYCCLVPNQSADPASHGRMALLHEAISVSLAHSQSVIASPSTQELLSHAGCLCRSRAEGVTPQGFMVAPSPSSPRRRRLSVRHREVLIRWHLTAPARKAGRGLGTRSAAATLDACRALLADHLSYGDRWGNPPAGA
ncbi:unnamed protein product [Pleuronectes platessa]|uniref:Uncharacterized protein n=1 Tax=Pleuronectes platessa TaxID=8262 RepID=A0A9N7Y8S7_PLEPL|nr:unnamed protein product [Pleuronectes platessa]